MKSYQAILALVASLTLSSCVVPKEQPVPHAKLHVVNRAGNGKEATECVIKAIDGKLVTLDGEQKFIRLHPGSRRISFTYQKWTQKGKKQFVSLKPIIVESRFKAGGVYWLDVGTLHIETPEGICSSKVTDGHLVYGVDGRVNVRKVY